jgi:hypothetical protein
MNAENPVQIDLFGVSATRTKRLEAGRAYRRIALATPFVGDPV